MRYGLTTLAALILVLIVYFFLRLFGEARPAFSAAGVFGFVFHNDWNVSAEKFGALSLVVGTLITSTLALLMGVPIAVATAICRDRALPARACWQPLTILVELLAAVPSVVYGLWGIFFLAPEAAGPPSSGSPTASPGSPSSAAGIVTIPNYFIAGFDPRDHDPADRPRDLPAR